MFKLEYMRSFKQFTLTLVISLSVLFCTSSINAQDIHFSQFYNAPTYINPALTGVFDGNFRTIANYRNQWSSITSNPYETMAFYVDGTPFAESINNGFMGIGLGFYQDQAGDGKLGTSQLNLTLSYSQHLADNQSLGAGIQVGYGQRTIDYTNLTWDNQWNGSAYDPSLGSGEPNPGNNFSYMDVSGGLLWYFYPNEKFNLKLGGSMYHVNQPNQSFFSNGDDKLKPRYVVHAAVDISITDKKFYVLPRAIFMTQGPSSELLLGAFASYQLQDNANAPTISGGLWYRNGDAFILATELWYGNFRLGLSYDVNVSGLSAASNSQGGPEVSLTTIFPLPSQSRYKKIPCPVNF